MPKKRRQGAERRKERLTEIHKQLNSRITEKEKKGKREERTAKRKRTNKFLKVRKIERKTE